MTLKSCYQETEWTVLCVVIGRTSPRAVTSQWHYKENERQGKCRKNKNGVD